MAWSFVISDASRGRDGGNIDDIGIFSGVRKFDEKYEFRLSQMYALL